jgi:hypothetical protein
MIRVAITAQTFDAIAATLPLGTVAFEPNSGTREGERHIWLEPGVANKLRSCAAPARAIPTSSCGWSNWRGTAIRAALWARPNIG